MVKPVAIFGPSGVGKGSVIKNILKRYSDKTVFSISHTTRKPRAGETNGVDYFFISEEEFLRMIENNEFLEWAIFNGNRYGTSINEFKRICTLDNTLPIIEIEIQGILALKSNRDIDIYLIKMLPPGDGSILFERLMKRSTENIDVINERVQRAKEELEIYKNVDVDYTVVNVDIDETTNEVINILKKFYSFLDD